MSSSLPIVATHYNLYQELTTHSLRKHEPPATVACEQAQGGVWEDHQGGDLGGRSVEGNAVQTVVHGAAKGELQCIPGEKKVANWKLCSSRSKLRTRAFEHPSWDNNNKPGLHAPYRVQNHCRVLLKSFIGAI